MTALPRVITLRVASLVALGASGALMVDTLRPERGFCRLEVACARARESVLGTILGMPTSALGAAAFGAVLVLTFLPLRWAHRLLRPAGLLAAFAALVFIAYQVIVLRSICPFCIVADTAGLALGAAVVSWRSPTVRLARDHASERRSARLAWALGGALAVALPFAWPQPARRPAWVPVPDAAIADFQNLPLEPVRARGTTPEPAPLGSSPSPAPRVAPAPRELPPARAPTATPRPTAPPVPPIASPAPVDRPHVPPVESRPPPSTSSARGGVPDPPPAKPPDDPPPAVSSSPPAASGPPPEAPSVTVSPPPFLPTPPDPPPPTVVAPPAEPPRPEVTIVEYLNPFCAHCRATHARLERLLASTSVPARRWRVYVWSTGDPPLWAKVCACAPSPEHEVALFSELLRSRSDAKSIWKAAERVGLRVGLDVEALRACVARGDADARLQGERQRVMASRIEGLPTFDIGRRRLQGEQSEGELREAIEAALAEATHAGGQ